MKDKIEMSCQGLPKKKEFDLDQWLMDYSGLLLLILMIIGIVGYYLLK